MRLDSFFASPSFIFMILTKSGLNLAEHVLNVLKSGKEISQDMAGGWIDNIIAAVNRLHLEGMTHRDVKPENFVLGKDNSLKLIDYGSSWKTNLKRRTLDLPTPSITDPYLAFGTVRYLCRGLDHRGIFERG